MRNFLFLLFVIVWFSIQTSQGQIISTFAGMGVGSGGYSGDGGLATAAHIGGVGGSAFDAFGNLYFAIRGGHRVRKVSHTGIITTVAGTGSPGAVGDGGMATDAQINSPLAVAIDTSGNLYIADYYNSKIRKVDFATGIITTIAGNGTHAFSGDGGPATGASLNYPNNICFDYLNNLYIADWMNHRVRKVTPSGIITTVAGNNSIGYTSDGGLADTTTLNDVWGIAVDSSNNVYLADNGNYRIRRIDNVTGIITTIAGNGNGVYNGEGLIATNAQFVPYGLAFDIVGNLYFADKAWERVRKVDTNGRVYTVAGTGTSGFSGDGGPSTSALLYNPESISTDICGSIYISDLQNQRIRKVSFPTPIFTYPTISLSGTTSMPLGSTVTVNATVASAGSSYIIHWMNHGVLFASTTVPVVTYTKTPGADTITARVVSTATYGCYDSTTSLGHIVISATTGLLMPAGRDIFIYPNPANNELTIENAQPGSEYKLYDVVGAIKQQGILPQSNNTIPLHTLPSGMYLLQMADTKGARTIHKIIKE